MLWAATIREVQLPREVGDLQKEIVGAFAPLHCCVRRTNKFQQRACH